jgi:hypothetical protein
LPGWRAVLVNGMAIFRVWGLCRGILKARRRTYPAAFYPMGQGGFETRIGHPTGAILCVNFERMAARGWREGWKST